MATSIKQLALKGTNTGIYVRTSTGAVNCDPNLWQNEGVSLNKQTYTDTLDGNKVKTRVLLSEVLNKIPNLVDKKLENRLGNDIIGSSNVNNSSYDELISNQSLRNDNKPLSSASTIKIIETSIGSIIDKLDEL